MECGEAGVSRNEDRQHRFWRSGNVKATSEDNEPECRGFHAVTHLEQRPVGVDQ